MALERGDASDAEQPPARRGTGRHFGCVDAGRHDVHTTPGQRIVVAQPPPGPLARDHDRGRHRQRHDLSRLVPRRVQEYDEAQPTRFGLQHLRYHRCDQAVDKNQCARRHPGQRRSDGRTGRRVRPGPPAGHGVLVGPTNPARQARDRPGGRTRCRRSAAAGRRSRRGPQRAPRSQRHFCSGDIVDNDLVHSDLRNSPTRYATRAGSPRSGPAHSRSPRARRPRLGRRAGPRSASRGPRWWCCARQAWHFVEVAVVEVLQDATQHLGGPADIHHDVVGVELDPEKVASTTYVAPCRRCAGPNTSPRRLCAIIT